MVRMPGSNIEHFNVSAAVTGKDDLCSTEAFGDSSSIAPSMCIAGQRPDADKAPAAP